MLEQKTGKKAKVVGEDGEDHINDSGEKLRTLSE